MPLPKIQTEVLRLLAAQRDPESYVAGATPLNRDAARYSGDIGNPQPASRGAIETLTSVLTSHMLK